MHARKFPGRLTLALPATLLMAACAPAAATPTAAATPVPTIAPAASAATSSPATTTGSSVLAVNSSVAGGALSDPVEWIATVGGVSASDPIDHVDFLIDGTVVWTEHNVPYQFNDDGNLLMPWVLAPGRHQLAINAATASGASATTQATVTTARPAVPPALLGKTFARVVPASPQTPAGTWRITFGANGVIVFDDPNASGGNEGFVATPDGAITLYGPANWIEPSKDRQGGFCDTADGVAKMRWQLQASDLELSTVGTDPCDGRSFLFTGTWTLNP